MSESNVTMRVEYTSLKNKYWLGSDCKSVKGLSENEVGDLQSRLSQMLASGDTETKEFAEREKTILDHYMISPRNHAELQKTIASNPDREKEAKENIEALEKEIAALEEDLNSKMWRFGAAIGLTEYSKKEVAERIAQLKQNLAAQKAVLADIEASKDRVVAPSTQPQVGGWDSIAECGESMGKDLAQIDANSDGIITKEEADIASKNGLAFGKDIFNGKDQVAVTEIIRSVTSNAEYMTAAMNAIKNA